MNTIIKAGVGALAVLFVASGEARADQIDGQWCYKDGKHLSIDGPKIVTPGGKAMTGEYDRHGFRYIVPAGEPHAGSAITMVQLDDETINVQVGEDPGIQVWNRCKLKIS